MENLKQKMFIHLLRKTLDMDVSFMPFLSFVFYLAKRNNSDSKYIYKKFGLNFFYFNSEEEFVKFCIDLIILDYAEDEKLYKKNL